MNTNEKIWKIGRIFVPIFLALVAAVYAYGVRNGRVEAAEKIDANKIAIIGLQKDIEYIKKAVDRIEKKIE